MTEIPAESNYDVEPHLPDAETKCHCGACDWRGEVSAMGRITSCDLTPGEIVPAGRCPVCSNLAYVENDSADRLAAVLEAARSLKIDAKSLNDERRIDRIIRIGLGEKS